MTIINACIETVTNGRIEDGFLRFENGKILAVGPMSEYVPLDHEIDAGGSMLLPGFLDIHCHLGMWEDGLNFEGADGNEITNPATPQLRAIDAINPMDRCFVEAALGGVTTVVTGPGSANPIGGQMAAIKTGGELHQTGSLPEGTSRKFRMDDLILKAPVAIKMALGENPKTCYNGKGQTPMTRMGTAAIIRETLTKAKRYMEKLDAAAGDPSKLPEFDAKLDALVPLLRGEIKAHIHAHRADDIFTAIRLAKEFGFDYLVIHCSEGHLIADQLKEEGVFAVVGPLVSDRSKPELRNATTANPAYLEKAGVPFAMCTDHPVIPIQYLALQAMVCGADGLTRDTALRALTILPAQAIGLADRVGSLEPGKDADFALYRRDPLLNYERPQAVYISGHRM